MQHDQRPQTITTDKVFYCVLSGVLKLFYCVSSGVLKLFYCVLSGVLKLFYCALSGVLKDVLLRINLNKGEEMSTFILNCPSSLTLVDSTVEPNADAII